MNAVLNSILNRIPELDCIGKCTESCTEFRVYPAEELEIKQYCIDNDIPFTPFLKNEDLRLKIINGCDQCKYLKNDKCSIYPVRPVICRLWGNTGIMKCEFGCKPETYLTHDEAQELVKEVRAL